MKSLRNVVLVVENDDDMRDLLSTALSHAHFNPLEASSGRQALSFLDIVAPAAIVIDFLLADMDGAALAQAIRRRSPEAQTPIIVVTGTPEVAEQHLLDVGLQVQVFAKPFAADVLTRAIEDLCAVGSSSV